MADHTPQRALRTPSTSTLTLPMPTPSGPSSLTRKMSMDLRRHSFRIPSTSVPASSKVPSSTSLATSSTRSPVKVLSAATRKLVPARPLSSTTPSTSDLPILRFQYVARNIYVSIGASWRFPRAERKNIQLTTTAGPEPFLTVFCSTTSSKFVLPADTVVEHSHDQLKLKSSSDSSLRLKLRFATFADAAIWRRLVGDALAQAAWRRDHEDVDCLSQDASCRVVVARRVGMKNEYIIKTHIGKRVEDVAEVALLRKLRPLLASLADYRVVETAQDVQLIMPRHAGKTLLAYLSAQPRKAMDESEARRVVGQMSETLAVLHGNGVVHCDLKLENVLVTDHARDVCVIDFGGAYDKEAPASKGPTMMVGTPGYIAPERILQVDAAPTPAADVFSLGILLYQMLVGQHPYAKAQAARRRLTMNDSLSLDWAHMERQLCARHVSREAQELLAQLVAADPSERITLEQLVNHEWFTNQSA